MTNQQHSPWASGEGFGAPRPQPDEPTAEQSNYSNAGLFGEPTRRLEPTGWSEPQHFSALPPAHPAPVQFGHPVPYGYGEPALPEHPNTTLVFTLGIIGLATNLFFLPVVSPVAWYLGAKAKREMANYPGVYRDSGRLTAGFVLGVIGSLFALAVLIFIVLMVVAAMAWH
ncbi:hypothetical protein [Micropruina sp.]|uniref:hypothetical protein n=1 Tax=Micropruina sp. TaxID=2737536 RepID=UPI0039E229A5